MEHRILDSHLHYGQWGRHEMQGSLVSPFVNHDFDTAEKLAMHLDRTRTEQCVLVPIYSPDTRLAYRLNSEILSVADSLPGRIIPGLWVDPSPSSKRRLFEALELARNRKVRVLKTSPQTWEGECTPDPATWNSGFANSIDMILDHARDNQCVVQIHTGSGKSRIQLIEKLIQYAGKDIRFHLVHMGNTASGHFYLIPRLRSWLDDGYKIACDTSWARGFGVRWLIDLADCDSTLRRAIMFASDEPWSTFESEIEKVTSSIRDRSELLIDILWANAYSWYVRRDR